MVVKKTRPTFAAAYFLVAVQFPFRPPDMFPEIELPATLPVYCTPPAVNEISSPCSFPSAICVLPIDPVNVWNCCVSFSSPCGVVHVPSTLAGTIHSSAVHQLVQSSVTFSVWSASQSSMV